jgi:hypothetical protein
MHVYTASKLLARKLHYISNMSPGSWILGSAKAFVQQRNVVEHLAYKANNIRLPNVTYAICSVPSNNEPVPKH